MTAESKSASSGGGPATLRPGSPGRAALIAQAFRLEYATVGWMAVEAAVAIWSGVRAGSITLLAFGIDSLIELASAGLLLWRLDVELRRGGTFAEDAERMASRIGGALLLMLAAYVVGSAAWSLWNRDGASFSWPGFIVAALAIPLMYGLARRKLAVATALGSRAMRTDAVESITCGWLSFVVVLGLAAQAVTGAWWVDAVASFAIVYLLVREGIEAWQGDECCEHESRD
jgi:divalent metal cation (Fe/Co/Zn/Cd) transporter